MTRNRFYAVATGRRPGIYTEWQGPEGARVQVDGVPGAKYRGFATRAEAEAWLSEMAPVAVAPVDAAPELQESAPGREAPTRPGQPVITLTGSRPVHIYTDGGCIGNPGPGGYGVVVQCGARRVELSGGFRLTTNNRMELMACIVGLRALRGRGAARLFSDSKYVVDAMAKGWAERWRAHGWWRNKRERAENTDLWTELLALCDEREVEFIWVRGHAGHPMNERCDQLAMAAAQQPGLPADVEFEEGQGSTRDQLRFA